MPPHNIIDLVNLFLGLINPLLLVLAGLSLLWFFKGLVAFIFKAGDPKEIEEGRSRMIWGLVALFVLVALWAIIAVLKSTFGFGPLTGFPLLPTKH